MNGMIFAAGLGTRLAPITNSKPKALVCVDGRPLLARALDNFCRGGVTNVVVNVHHFAEQIVQFVAENAHQWPTMNISISDESHALLDTGGGLANAIDFFSDGKPVIVGNADIFTNVPVDVLYHEHCASGRDATLLTAPRDTSRQLLFDSTNRLCGWKNRTTGQTKLPRPAPDLRELAFNGFHVVEHRILEAMLPVRKVSIIDLYLDLANRFDIGCLTLDDYFWFDIGTPEKLAVAEDFASKNKNENI